MNTKRSQLILPKHIQKGIDHYKGQPCPVVQKHLDNIGWKYKAYRFQDDRILLVFTNEMYALLYPDQEELYLEMNEADSVDN